MSKFFLVSSAIFILVCVTSTEAGFRCFFGDWACSAGCKVMGQKSGLCDDDGKCWCSEERISMDNLRSLLPSRCDMGVAVCQGTCHAIGRRDGTCSATGCECSSDRLSPTEFALCAAASTCRLHCQANGRSSGTCEGWSCRCETNTAGNLNEF